MILPIIHYGHPVLQQKGAEIHKVTDSIRQLASDMIETMYASKGIGLAAQQIGKALQLTVLDVRGADRPSQLFVGAREMSLDIMMPLMLLNPKITKQEGEEMGPEGCLSFPEIYTDIPCASTIHVSSTDLNEEPIQFIATGLLSRAVQHEIDHLNGILFIDRMISSARKTLEPDLLELKAQTLSELKKHHKKASRGV